LPNGWIQNDTPKMYPERIYGEEGDSTVTVKCSRPRWCCL